MWSGNGRVYAIEAFERYGADAVTVNPYLGGDSIAPFTKYADRGTILLCRTSNAGGADLQGNKCSTANRSACALPNSLPHSGMPTKNINLVVGATVPAGDC